MVLKFTSSTPRGGLGVLGVTFSHCGGGNNGKMKSVGKMKLTTKLL